MITLRNNLRKIKVSTTQLEKHAQVMLSSLGYNDFDLGILLTTNTTIRHYNKTFRKKDKATDILSFPYHTELKAGEKITVIEPEDKNLGDIIISVEYVIASAPEHGQTLPQRLDHLLAHGIAHLLGYDHQTEKEYKVMQALETKLLTTLI